MTSTENGGGDNQRWDSEKRERIAVSSSDGCGGSVVFDDNNHNDGDDHHNYNELHNKPNCESDPKTNRSSRDHIIVNNHDMSIRDPNTTTYIFVWILGKSLQSQSAVLELNVEIKSMRGSINRCQRAFDSKCVNRMAALEAAAATTATASTCSINAIGGRSYNDKGERTVSRGHTNSRAPSTSQTPTSSKLRQQSISAAIIYNDKLRPPKQRSTPKRDLDGVCYSSRFGSVAVAVGAASSFIVSAADVDVLVDGDDVYPSSQQQACVLVKRRSSRQRSTFSCLNELVKMYSARVKHIKKQLPVADRNSGDCGRSTEVNLRNCDGGQVVNTDRSLDCNGDNDVAQGSSHQDRHQQPDCDVSCCQCSDGDGEDKASKGNKATTAEKATCCSAASSVIENSNTKCRCSSARRRAIDKKCQSTHYRDVDKCDERVCSDYDEVDNSVNLRHYAQGVPSDSVVAAVGVEMPRYKFDSGKCNLCHTVFSAQSVATTTAMHTEDNKNKYFSAERRHSEQTPRQNRLNGSTNTNQLRIQCGDRLALSCSPTSDEGCPNHVSPYSSSSEDEDKSKCRRDFELKRSRDKVARSSSSDSALGLDEDSLVERGEYALMRPARRVTLTVMDLPLRPALLPVAEPTNLSDSQPQLLPCDDTSPIVPTTLLLKAQIIEISPFGSTTNNPRRYSRTDDQSALPDSKIDHFDNSTNHVRFVRTPSVVVSDYSDDLICGGITLEEIEFFRQQRQLQRRSSAQAGGGDYDSDLSTASSCSNLNYCGSTISAVDAEEMYMATASGLLTPERKISDCSTCSTISVEEDTFPMRLTEALQEQKKKVGRPGSN